MTNPLDDRGAFLRRAAYTLLIITAAGVMLSRIMSVSSKDGRTPFLSANDRSRWCTIRALVDHGTYEIDKVIVKNPRAAHDDQTFDKSWHTIDMVRHRGRDGKEHYYSSKPPLLPTLLAGPYLLINAVSDATFEESPFYVGRATLVAANLLPLLLYLILVAQLVERYGRTDRGRIFVVACAAWGTFLSTFVVTLNNHLPAAVSVLVAVCAALAIWRDGRRDWYLFAAAGFFAAFAAANELPALSFFVFIGAALLLKSPLRTMLSFVPAAAVVACGFFGTNYLAHETWIPAYAHRGKDGAVLTTVDKQLADELASGNVPAALREAVKQDAGVDLSNATVVADRSDDRWVLWDTQGHDRLAVVRNEKSLDVRAWYNWYEYQGSYWTPGKQEGVDLGEPSRLAYAWHVLGGHHGIFSLTPIWLLAATGLVMLLLESRVAGSYKLQGLAIMTLVLTIVCLSFYISRPLVDRNYGGVTSGLRWLFWFTPMWLLCMIPAADRFAQQPPLRWTALALLAASTASATYAASNPWSHPWAYDYWMYLGGT